MFEQVIEFYRTASVNTNNNSKIGKVSDKYKVEITPGDNTFLIWPVIYAQLLAYALTSNVSQKQVDLFVQSMRLNSKWIHAFVEEDLTKSLEIITELELVNSQLAEINTVTIYQAAFDMYATWVSGAKLLSEAIYNTYVLKKSDNSYNDLKATYESMDSKKMRNWQKWTIVWFLIGVLKQIDDKDKKDELFDIVKPYVICSD